MPGKTTVALTDEQYREIIQAMRTGSSFFRPNIRIATVLILETNLGVRIEDILALRLCDIVLDAGKYRLHIKELKTSKTRRFTVPNEVYTFIKDYCDCNNINKEDKIFPIGERTVQKYLKKVCDYLGYENISTHSFRKYAGMRLYEYSNHDIFLVKEFYQHSSIATTQRYLSITPTRLEEAITQNVRLPDI